MEAFTTQQESNRVWATHLGGGHAESFARRSTAQFESVENVVSGRFRARPVGGLDWPEVKPTSTNAFSEIPREL